MHNVPNSTPLTGCHVAVVAHILDAKIIIIPCRLAQFSKTQRCHGIKI